MIKLTSKGPVLFRQKRVGQYGRTFTFLKFRSMKVHNDHTIHKEYVTQFITSQLSQRHNGQDAKPVIYKLTGDPRVTRVGKFLRRTSLDELPQFLNVLTGEMSLVGPRPPVPYEFGAYDIWHRQRMLAAKPGITGLWQVQGRSRVTFDEMVRLDLRYAKTASFWLDVAILLQTPRAVLTAAGAY
jgi:lipopolysaccharide/colanic/teichoic acid biosynthesis glycosyltransferase